jgi:uncharacterized delta-60 repeat protein
LALNQDHAFAVAIQGDGKIIAVGSANGPGTLDFALTRYNSDGSLDVTFGSTEVTTDFAGGNDQAHGVAIQADSKIVAAGYGASNAQDFFLALQLEWLPRPQLRRRREGDLPWLRPEP